MSGFSIYDTNACELGEGPTFDPDTGTAWWFDINGKKLFERPAGGDATIVHDLPVMASALAVVDAERHLIAAEDGLYIRQPKSGKFTRLLPLEDDDPATRSNDSRVHPSGAFWIGTMGKHGEKGAGAFYHFRRGEIRKLYSDITVPNAICFSADGSIGHFTDTETGQVMRVPLDPETGLPTGEPTVFLDKGAQGAGHPDGAVVDGDGLFWNARWEGFCVSAFDASGAMVESINLPAGQITCPSFIGDDRMIVTSAFAGLDDATRAEQPAAGQTFLVDRAIKARYCPKVLL